MKKYSAVPAILILIIGFVVIAYAGDKSAMPAPAGNDLRKYVIDVDPYKNWILWPGTINMSEGTEPHGAFVTIYINEAAFWSLKKMKGFRNNSIVLKENFNKNKKLEALTVMYKVKGFNPDGGDWFWAKYDKNHNVISEGKIAGCLDCHADASINDYVFSGKAK
ncbi:MAG: cytochrome P460 family protein [Nitrospirota bacterium]